MTPAFLKKDRKVAAGGFRFELFLPGNELIRSSATTTAFPYALGMDFARSRVLRPLQVLDVSIPVGGDPLCDRIS